MPGGDETDIAMDFDAPMEMDAFDALPDGFDGDVSMPALGDDEPAVEEDEDSPTAGMSERTINMMRFLQDSGDVKEARSFSSIVTKESSRRTAARSFFELLVLKTKGFIDVEQDQPFADITVTPTARFHSDVPEILAAHA